MKVVISLQLVLQALLAIVFSTAGRADDAFQAKIQYCKTCHGLSGQGYHGFLLMPRLAGQTTEYFENQLRAFAELRREKDIVIDMAKVHAVAPEMRTALAEHFRDLNTRPFGGAPKDRATTGKKVYDEGVPEANVPACSTCHGPEAKGDGLNPRLAGQLYPYTIKELTHWSKERGQDPGKDDTSAIMLPISHSLTQSQIAAIASYLSYLE
jgi:cytochrome c553